MEMFLEKNEKQLEELFQYVENNRDEIHAILTSPEMFEYIKSLALTYIKVGDTDVVFNRKIIIVNKWSNSNRIRFVMKEPHFDFNLPCLCGIYNDEIHH